jgi:hypothetical protein
MLETPREYADRATVRESPADPFALYEDALANEQHRAALAEARVRVLEAEVQTLERALERRVDAFCDTPDPLVIEHFRDGPSAFHRLCALVEQYGRVEVRGVLPNGAWLTLTPARQEGGR